MSEDRLYDVLSQTAEIIQEEIDRLQVGLKAVLGLLERSPIREKLSSNTDTVQPLNEKVGPTKAIIQMFDNSPNYNWTPGELRNKLLKLRKDGKLASKSTDMLSAVHSILKHLIKIEHIEKDSNKQIPTYRRKLEKENGKLF